MHVGDAVVLTIIKQEDPEIPQCDIIAHRVDMSWQEFYTWYIIILYHYTRRNKIRQMQNTTKRSVNITVIEKENKQNSVKLSREDHVH